MTLHRAAAAPAALLLVAPLLAACQPEEVRLVEGTRSEARYPDAGLRFEAPAPGEVLPGGDLEARLTVEGFAPGETTSGVEDRGLAVSGEGQHIHFIVDNEPYTAVYDLTEPVELSGLEPGFHVLRAFPARQWHESVKEEGAFAMTWFSVEDTTAGEGWSADDPLLTYSRPKGTYTGAEVDSVMVDFYLANVEIGPGEGEHQVRLTVDDTLSWGLTRWAPHYVLGLPAGEHTFRLELLGPDGEPTPGRFNSTERTITVVREGGE